MEAYLAEKSNLKLALLPVDLNTGANTGLRVSIKDCDRIAFVVAMGDSTAAVVTISFQQHNAASAGTSKALSHSNLYYKKAGAATSFTKVEPTSAASSYDLAADFAAQEGLVVFEVLAEDLDVTNDFAWVSLDIADTTAAKVGSVVAITGGLRNAPGYSQVL
tara:strand:+ start:538 stop:1023 length:486 start_codon:yes stop_codon:yes gene_type:complete